MAVSTSIRGSTQQILPIEDIKDDFVILKDGSVCLALETTALNFGLLSEAEQDATIYAYAALLNSLTFPIQILIQSQRKDISSYLDLLAGAEKAQKNPLLKNQISKYRQFVEETVKKNNVLAKRFFIIIPFSHLELGVKQALGSTFLPRKVSLPFSKSYILEKAKIALHPKRDHLLRQLSRIGLVGRQLTTYELVALFYEIYNPEAVENQKVAVGGEYTAPIVQPTMKIS